MDSKQEDKKTFELEWDFFSFWLRQLVPRVVSDFITYMSNILYQYLLVVVMVMGPSSKLYMN